MPAEKFYSPTQVENDGSEPLLTVRWGDKQDVVQLVNSFGYTIELEDRAGFARLIRALQSAYRQTWPDSKLEPNSKNWVEYMRANGVAENTVLRNPGPVRWELADGVFQIHYVEFLLTEDGRKVMDNAGPVTRPTYVVETVPPATLLLPFDPVWYGSGSDSPCLGSLVFTSFAEYAVLAANKGIDDALAQGLSQRITAKAGYSGPQGLSNALREIERRVSNGATLVQVLEDFGNLGVRDLIAVGRLLGVHDDQNY